MHYHCEIVIPPVMNVEEAVTAVMKEFCEHGDNEDGERNRHGFWDFWSIGGRFAGTKLIAQYDETKLDEFYAWLKSEKVTVSGVTCGKQELSPADQIPKVDAKWNEMFPSAEFLPCPLFRHSSNPYGKSLGEALPCDVQRLADVPEKLKCCRVIFAKPSYNSETKQYTGPLEAEFMLVEHAWNGCNHMKVDWDGTVVTALAKYRDMLKHYESEFAAMALPKDDWLVVTVDYHS